VKIYDLVELINDKDRYGKHGVYKGMFGAVMPGNAINGEWQVIFSEFHTGKDIADISVKEADLKIHEFMPLDRIPKK
jgi:hypothetical protein